MSSEQLPEQPALPPGTRTAHNSALLLNAHGQQVVDYMLHLELPRQMGRQIRIILVVLHQLTKTVILLQDAKVQGRA